jgi:hypothetical protein
MIKGWSKKEKIQRPFFFLIFLDSFPYHMSLDTEKEDEEVCMRWANFPCSIGYSYSWLDNLVVTQQSSSTVQYNT